MNNEQRKRLLPLDVISGFDVARFLNACDESNPSDRDVLKVFELSKKMDELNQKMKGIRADRAPNYAPESYKTVLSEWQKTHVAEINKTYAPLIATINELNRILPQFQFTPVVAPDGSLLWSSVHAPGEKGVPASGIVISILEMTKAGTIDRVRQCLCGQWFLAVKDNKVVCSDPCRQRKMKAMDPAKFNKKRAEDMRKYRKTKKAREQRKGTSSGKKTR